MNVVDSSGWLEYFANGPHAEHFAKPLQDVDHLIVPTITLFEVFKVVLRERDENDAFEAIALMKQGKEVGLSSKLAIESARNSLIYKIPMADSIILTTAQSYQAIIWTQDEDFEDLDNVRYFPK
ncbi:MAG: type II toxin-antitoxin system VapC family toxin [Gammaproteobacteria bacterium]|nr:MAG: type II toxin-antitoxin system VapC family toxin [Gammaproteobacteria bacterium]